jgi:hypothetical protein
LAARSLANFADGIVENILPAAANEDMRPVSGESYGYLFAKARSAAGHEDTLALQNVASEHGRENPLIRPSHLGPTAPPRAANPRHSEN